MAPTNPSWPPPSHPEVLEVIRSDEKESYTSFSRSNISAAPGTIIACLENPPLKFAEKAYSTVQISQTQHVELNCDFLYLNHSCEPTLELHVIQCDKINRATASGEYEGSQCCEAIEIRIAERRNSEGKAVGIEVGDEMTFFYPSTEWEMAQPFDCSCATKSCRGQISGAKDMTEEKLKNLFLNKHIAERLRSVAK